ncbi:nucleotidyltransferase family protein [Anaeromusa acidaminophila]|uniref:nucleotidyltransferase family protein n=1 Tax=Anaeromusa acidaminophila TaxID=81464 RepID=UPI00036558C7|nr:nucleotidyltransferase family protein [Anaeromusa acidaminophila]
MKHWQSVKLHPQVTVLEAMQIIDASALQIGLVVDENDRLLGTVTDGDVRRAILKGSDLSNPVEKVMNSKPVTIRIGEGRERVLRIMRERMLRQLPVLDEEYRVIGLERLDELLSVPLHDNWVVLMAGGLGSRLGELTKDCPKPLIPVGGKPLLETIIENFKEYGFQKFFLSVNYKAEMIQEYFNTGKSLGVQVEYLQETKRLGTAGAISLLPEKPVKPIIVMNGDLLTKVNFQQLLDFHLQQKAIATMCVREYTFQVPYGVVRMENEQLQAIDEKPVQKFFVNAGIYVLEPDAVELIPQEIFFDMTNLFDILLHNKQTVSIFPVREYWLDIGQRADLERANGEFWDVFG